MVYSKSIYTVYKVNNSTFDVYIDEFYLIDSFNSLKEAKKWIKKISN